MKLLIYLPLFSFLVFGSLIQAFPQFKTTKDHYELTSSDDNTTLEIISEHLVVETIEDDAEDAEIVENADYLESEKRLEEFQPNGDLTDWKPANDQAKYSPYHTDYPKPFDVLNFPMLFEELSKLEPIQFPGSEEDPDRHKTIEEIIQSRGFNVQHHNITTADGYILTLHRLVDSLHVSSEANRKPVILQHGLFESSADWLISSPFLYSNTSESGDNLGFGLHLTGRYDVWLANSRGNEYSQGHRDLSIKNNTYWRFSFDQMSQFDMPAIIEYVREVTKRDTVGFIGFSQGTASMFAFLSLNPEYADIVKPFIALAPIATVGGIHPAPEFDYVASGCIHFLCGKPSEIRIPSILSGPFWASTNINASRIPIYTQFSNIASTWELLHWSQLVLSGRFTRFSFYEESENIAAYGQAEAPDFPLQNIPSSAIIALIRSENDDWSTMPNQEKLLRILEKSGVEIIDYVVPDKTWGHTDFVHGIDAGRLVYDKVIEILDQFVQ